MTQSAQAKVVVFTLGGTIAMTAGPSSGAVPALSATDLIGAVPALKDTGIDLAVRDFRQLPGASLAVNDLLDLIEEIEEQVQDGVTGVVITQGTDTIEESAFLLDLLYAGGAPVVVTGAMRNPSLAGADGPANLLAAVQTAVSPAMRGLGVLVAFGDEIHAARYVRKVHSTSPAAFASPNTGPVGHVVEGVPRLLARPTGPRVTLEVPPRALTTSIRVPVWTVTLGDDGRLLGNLVLEGGGIDAVVVAGFGVGHVPQTMVRTLSGIAREIPVVLASRTGAGSVLAGMYGFPGSERDLLDRGLISAGFLDPVKARVLLHLLACHAADPGEVARCFDLINTEAGDRRVAFTVAEPD